ncbi:hypothetical protein Slin14017_G050170 [Septoria linicola]|nr:hypothetical protein Slin14017_G050170 [Septoria linicola]
MPTKVDKVVEYLLSWMTTHADSLRALTAKIGSLEEYIKVSPLITRDLETGQAGHDLAGLVAESPVLSGRMIAQPARSILLWPEVRKLFMASRTTVDEAYVERAEETHPPWSDMAKPTDGDVDNMTLATINVLHGAFLAKIHTLQPFLNHSRLTSLMERFRYKYASDTLRSPAIYTDSGDEPERPAKRRRTGSPSTTARRKQQIERSPENAIALLILALGATTRDNASQRQSPVGSTARRLPGVLYYSEAVKVMSTHMDGSDLQHAQMFLLAGMYKVEIGRVAEGASWFSMAGRVLLYLVQRNGLAQELCRQSTPNRNSRDGQVLLAAWSCLQLEAHVPPELRLPTSGLHRLAGLLPRPYTVADMALDDERIACQVSVALCELHALQSRVEDPYGKGVAGRGSSCLNDTVKQYATYLQKWRTNLPKDLHWDDDRDAPSTSAALAPLRHKYWTLKLSLMLPFLDYVLHISPGLAHGMDLQTCLKDAKGLARPMSEQHILVAVDTLAKASGEDEITRLAELCTQAIRQKLVAFDGIFASTFRGSMLSPVHDQFHDLLLLTAVHRSKRLSHLTSRSFLQLAYEQTIDSLERLSSLSPICKEDCKFLKRIQSALIDTPGG